MSINKVEEIIRMVNKTIQKGLNIAKMQKIINTTRTDKLVDQTIKAIQIWE